MKYGKIMILGDSYSTYEGYIPSGYATYYYDNHDVTDIERVEQTWWKRLIDLTGDTLLLNCSFSGTTICNTGYGGQDFNSFIRRFKKRITEGYFEKEKPNTLFLFGGTNDSWAGSPIGDLQYENWTDDDLSNVLNGFCYLVDLIKKTLPDTKLVVIVNTEIDEKIQKGYALACKHYSADCVTLKKIDKICGHPTVCGMQKICDQIIEGV